VSEEKSVVLSIPCEQQTLNTLVKLGRCFRNYKYNNMRHR